MANKLHFDDGVFKNQLIDSLEPVTVSDSLRAKTLENCRQYLLSQEAEGKENLESTENVYSLHSLEGFGKIKDSGSLEGSDSLESSVSLEDSDSLKGSDSLEGSVSIDTNNTLLNEKKLQKQKVLEFHAKDKNFANQSIKEQDYSYKKTFLSRHANKIRVAAGIAACLLVVWMVQDFIPKMGSPVKSAMMTKNDTITESVKNSTAESQRAADQVLSEESVEAPMFAKAFPEEQEKTIEDSNSNNDNSKNSEIGTSSSQKDADNQQEVIVSGVGSSGQESEATMATFSGDKPIFVSWGYGTEEDSDLQKPNKTQIDEAIKNLMTNFPELVVYTEDLFFAYHVQSDLTKGFINQSQKFSDIIGEVGIWMLPAQQDGHFALIPLAPLTDSQYQAIEVLELQRDDWQNHFFQAEELLNDLKQANGNLVVDYKVLDIGNGRGFIVCWNNLYESSMDTEYMMPFLDEPEMYQLVNGQKYSFKEFKEAVIGLLP